MKKQKNRLGYKSFIKDRKKMEEYYEWALEHQYAIDMLDHLWIAMNRELGEQIEKKMLKYKKKYKKLKKKLRE